MNARLMIFLLAAAVLGNLVACRELTAPGSSDLPGPMELLVLDENGDPLVDKDVLVTDLTFVPLSDDVEWRGRTSEEGRVAVDLPPGRYSVVVWNYGDLFTRWIEPTVDLREGLTVLDPRPHLRAGRVLLPDSVEREDFRLSLDATLTHGIRPATFSFDAHVNSNGEVIAPWLDDTSYVVDLIDLPTRVRLYDDLVLAPTDSLHFEWMPEEFQIRLTLGGAPVPPSLIRVTAATPGSDVTTELTPDGPLVTFLGAAGVGRISIRHIPWLPFMVYEAPFEFRAGEVRQIELGDHRVEMKMLNAKGQDLYGCYLRIDDANTGGSISSSVEQDRTVIFLRPGQYKMSASRSGYEAAVLVANVASDTTFTFVLEPQEP